MTEPVKRVVRFRPGDRAVVSRWCGRSIAGDHVEFRDLTKDQNESLDALLEVLRACEVPNRRM